MCLGPLGAMLCSWFTTHHTQQHTHNTSMTYEESFLDTCDAEGIAPGWAIDQIFGEHNANLLEYTQAAGKDWDKGETILNWLGY